MDFLKTKNSYLTSIFIVVIVIAIVIFIWSKLESFENEEDENIEIKTQQCKDCKLQGNKFNSFLEIYKRSFNNRRFNNKKD